MSVSKKKIGLTFGAFDCCHRGHINLLKNAKSKCDFLIVCVSTDEYIRKVKNTEPIIKFEDRIANVEAIRYVDRVGIQTLSFGKKEAIKKYKPNILLVGSDWTPKTYTGMNLGVPVVFLPHTEGISSTKIRQRLKNKLK